MSRYAYARIDTNIGDRAAQSLHICSLARGGRKPGQSGFKYVYSKRVNVSGLRDSSTFAVTRHIEANSSVTYPYIATNELDKFRVSLFAEQSDCLLIVNAGRIPPDPG